MYKNRTCILLTACVNPNGMSYTALQNPGERKRQYIEAIDFYLSEINIPVVFVENTLTNFSNLFSKYISSGRMEYFTFDGNNYDRNYGKGYGEVQIIKYAYEHSSLLRQSKYVVKITGRLKILNIEKIISSKLLLLNNIIRCDFNRNIGLYSMLFVIQPHILYEIMKNDSWRLNDSKGIFFEHILYNAVEDRRIIPIPFLSPLQIDGVTGTGNVRYANRRLGENMLINLTLASDLCKNQGRYILSNLFKLLSFIPRGYFFFKRWIQ